MFVIQKRIELSYSTNTQSIYRNITINGARPPHTSPIPLYSPSPHRLPTRHRRLTSRTMNKTICLQQEIHIDLQRRLACRECRERRERSGKQTHQIRVIVRLRLVDHARAHKRHVHHLHRGQLAVLNGTGLFAARQLRRFPLFHLAFYMWLHLCRLPGESGGRGSESRLFRTTGVDRADMLGWVR